MTDALATALVVSVAPTLLAIATLVNSLRNGIRLKKVERSVNGLGDERNAATQKSAHAEGVLAEKEREAATHQSQ